MYDFLFPPVCFHCRALLSDGESRLCGRCWDSIPIVRETDRSRRILEERFRVHQIIDDSFSYYYFEHGGVLQTLAHELKYNEMMIFGFELGMRLGEKLSSLQPFASIDCIVPVPLNTVRLRERGYNQSEIICSGAAKRMKKPIYPHMVIRNKNTVTQTHLTAEQRHKNVADAFAVRDGDLSHIAGKSILIVDDIITTGATIEETGKILKDAGARHVYAASCGLAKLT